METLCIEASHVGKYLVMKTDVVMIEKDLLCLCLSLCSLLCGCWNGHNHKVVFSQYWRVSSHEESAASSFIAVLKLCGFEIKYINYFSMCLREEFCICV